MFKNTLRKSLAVAVVAVGLGVMAAGPAAAASESDYGMWHVTCGSRTDWVRMWTAHHGFPTCYAASTSGGYVWYGKNYPNDTWTTWGICAGNNDLYVSYFFHDGSGWHAVHNEHVGWGGCADWSKGVGTVEVEQILVAAR